MGAERFSNAVLAYPADSVQERNLETGSTLVFPVYYDDTTDLEVAPHVRLMLEIRGILFLGW